MVTPLTNLQHADLMAGRVTEQVQRTPGHPFLFQLVFGSGKLQYHSIAAEMETLVKVF
jgi:hypothetical protein